MSLNGSPRFLVIRRDNIGDLVCTTPLIAALRATYPGSYIAALVNSYNRDVLAGNPDIDEIFAYTKAKHRGSARSWIAVMTERIRLFFAMRRARIDVAILAAPGFQPRSLRMARWAGAKRVLGFVNHDSQGGIELGVNARTTQTLHEVEDVYRLATGVDIAMPPPAATVIPEASKLARIRDQMQRHFPASGPIIALHISARKPSQRWPAERFAELANRLYASHNARLLLLWAPGDAANAQHPGDDGKAQGIRETCKPTGMLAVPTTQLSDLIAALAVCDVVICADGGAMHIAAGLQKPIVCLFGDSQASRWHPWKTRYELLQSESRQVIDIGVDEVIGAARRMLAL
ncbi:MAG: glycosyltransferase family 9 protein [Burkholderiales bacterium]